MQYHITQSQLLNENGHGDPTKHTCTTYVAVIYIHSHRYLGLQNRKQLNKLNDHLKNSLQISHRLQN